MQRYLRLLSYENACKVIDFVNTNDKNDYANITVGGVSMQVSEQNWSKVELFIKSLTTRYEIGIEAPYKVEQKIVSEIKNANIIRYGWGNSTLKTWFITKTNKNFLPKGSKLLFVLTCQKTNEQICIADSYPSKGDVISDVNGLKLKINDMSWV